MVMLYGPPRLGIQWNCSTVKVSLPMCRHTMELLNRESQLAYVHKCEIFCSGVGHNNLH
jgi:hypothetical protein